MAIFPRSKSGEHAYWYSQLCLQNRRGIPSLPNACQQHSALPKTMPLALAGARTDSTTRYSHNARRGQFPRTRIGIVHKTRRAQCSSMRRGFCTLVLFILYYVFLFYGIFHVLRFTFYICLYLSVFERYCGFYTGSRV